MVDRRPQDFLNGTPDGVTDNTLAIQAAINAWLPGDQVIISGGTFRTSDKLTISQNGLLLTGTGSIRARPVFPINSSLIEVTATGVTIDADGLTLDQADMMFNGISIRALAAVGLQILGVISRGNSMRFSVDRGGHHRPAARRLRSSGEGLRRARAGSARAHPDHGARFDL